MTLRILVVDDNPDMRDSLVMVLQHLGHEAREAASGPEALAFIEAWRPNIALVDLEMPSMSGYEICERARGSSAGRSTAFVALTGWDGEGPRTRAQAAGFFRHVVKPLALAELRELIDEVANSVQPAMTRGATGDAKPAKRSDDDPSPLDHPNQEQHDGDHQQHVDEPAHGVRGHKSEQPQDDKDDSKGGQHGHLPGRKGG